jgi:hypothetical protein
MPAAVPFLQITSPAAILAAKPSARRILKSIMDIALITGGRDASLFIWVLQPLRNIKHRQRA